MRLKSCDLTVSTIISWENKITSGGSLKNRLRLRFPFYFSTQMTFYKFVQIYSVILGFDNRQRGYIKLRSIHERFFPLYFQFLDLLSVRFSFVPEFSLFVWEELLYKVCFMNLCFTVIIGKISHSSL